jgi:hypothetical protein
MSSIDVAHQATSTDVHEVISREELFSGPIIRIRVSADAFVRTYEDTAADHVPYLQVPRVVPGGCINLFVRTDDDSVIGEMITAKATVMKKTMVSGREYLYIDLDLVPDGTKVTHRLGIMDTGPGSWDDNDWAVFETPQSINALIIFGPPDAKFVRKEEQRSVTPAEACVPRPQSVTDDTQLNRLISDGWTISAEDAATVTLTRPKNGEPKTMTHHRPKPGGGKKRRT